MRVAAFHCRRCRCCFFFSTFCWRSRACDRVSTGRFTCRCLPVYRRTTFSDPVSFRRERHRASLCLCECVCARVGTWFFLDISKSNRLACGSFCESPCSGKSKTRIKKVKSKERRGSESPDGAGASRPDDGIATGAGEPKRNGKEKRRPKRNGSARLRRRPSARSGRRRLGDGAGGLHRSTSRRNSRCMFNSKLFAVRFTKKKINEQRGNGFGSIHLSVECSLLNGYLNFVKNRSWNESTVYIIGSTFNLKA